MIGGLFSNLLRLYLEAAPWLLLGLAAAGVIKAWVPEGRVGRWLGGRGPWPVVKAALVGAPLPLCSCGVLPAALGLRRAGADVTVVAPDVAAAIRAADVRVAVRAFEDRDLGCVWVVVPAPKPGGSAGAKYMTIVIGSVVISEMNMHSGARIASLRNISA